LEYLTNKILSGGSGVWGNIPMPAQNLKPADAKAIAEWLAGSTKP
jgi:cytochrome c